MSLSPPSEPSGDEPESDPHGAETIALPARYLWRRTRHRHQLDDGRLVEVDVVGTTQEVWDACPESGDSTWVVVRYGPFVRATQVVF